MATYMTSTQVLELVSLKRLANSRNGNPRFAIALGNGQGGKTKTDASFAYAICENWVGKRVRAVYRVTSGGRLVFTDLELTK